MKKLFALIFFTFITALFVPMLAKAQVMNLPGIYVKNLSLDKSIYNAGGTVKGTFTLSNIENYAVSNIYYNILLMGNYKNTVPSIQYDRTDLIGPINLSAGEKKTIVFSYSIPNGLNGNGFGIQVHAAMQNGTGLGWSDSMINVVGGGGFLKFSQGYLEVGKDKFGLQDGPMIYKDGKAYLNVTFSNTSIDVVSAIPNIKIFNRSENGELLKEFSQDKITIKVGGSVSLKIELPTFNFDPKVYVGKLDLTNSKGDKVAPTTDFRYIVFGDIVTVNQVMIDKESVRKGESVMVTVYYSGAPFDVVNGKRATSTPVDLSINIFNEGNKLVGSYAGKEDFNAKNKSILNISAKEDAKTLRVEVTASRDGKVLTKYGTMFTGDLGKKKETFSFLDSLGIKGLSALIIGIIALLSLVFIRFVSKSRILLIFIAFVIVVLSVIFFLTNSSSVKAWTQDSYSSGGDGSIYDVFVNSPSGDYAPGSYTPLQVGAYATACSNRSMALSIAAAGQTASVGRVQYGPDPKICTPILYNY